MVNQALAWVSHVDESSESTIADWVGLGAAEIENNTITIVWSRKLISAKVDSRIPSTPSIQVCIQYNYNGVFTQVCASDVTGNFIQGEE